MPPQAVSTSPPVQMSANAESAIEANVYRWFNWYLHNRRELDGARVYKAMRSIQVTAYKGTNFVVE